MSVTDEGTDLSNSPPTQRETDRATAPSREFALDAWRAASLVRIMAFHFFGYAWLSTVFPALGIMFAAAGSLAARSLTSAGDGNASRVVYRRFRRVAPTVWVYGAALLLVSVIVGWGTGPAKQLLWWVLPLSTPGAVGGPERIVLTEVLWYIAAYLWFVLLSPVLLLALRSWPRLTLAVVILLPFGMYTDLFNFEGVLRGQARDLIHYAGCWVLGMAHREGLLARIPRVVFWPAVGLVTAVSAVTVLTAPVPSAFLLGHSPLVHALYQMAFAAAVLRLAPVHGPSRPSRVPAAVVRVVQMISYRSVTIYVWHFACIHVALWIVGPEQARTPTGMLVSGALTIGLVLLAMAAVGWVEDLAARRPVRLFGWPPIAASVPRQRSPKDARPSF